MADPSPFDGFDFYETLQISPNADLDTIHRVYRLITADGVDFLEQHYDANVRLHRLQAAV